MSAHLWDKSNVVDDCGLTLAFLGLVFTRAISRTSFVSVIVPAVAGFIPFRPQKKGPPNLPWGMGGIRPAQVNLEGSIEPSLARFDQPNFA
jgi:hypothetical protein